MSDFALAAAGVLVFAVTTWASLAFGYQVFQNMWETDQAGSAVSRVQSVRMDTVTPVLPVGDVNGETAPPNDFLPPSPSPA